MTGVLAMALGGFAGLQMASGAGARSGAEADKDDIVPLAYFPDGSFIGRVASRTAIARAFAGRSAGVFEDTVRDAVRDVISDRSWFFAFVRDGQVLSVMQFAPRYADGRWLWDVPLFTNFYVYNNPREDGTPGRLTLISNDRVQRGAWLWWLYEVLNPEGLPLEERWNNRAHLELIHALHVPVLFAPEDLNGPIQGYSPHSTLRMLVVHFLRLTAWPKGIDHGVWNATQIEGSGSLAARGVIKLHRSMSDSSTSPIGHIFYASRDEDTGLWSFNYISQALSLGPPNTDLVQALTDAGFILPVDDFEGWLDHHIVEGELVYDPEPFRLLDATEPAVMTLEQWRKWIGHPGGPL